MMNSNLCGSNGAAAALGTLPGVEAGLVTVDGLGCLLNNLLTLGKNHLDVAWVGHVWVDLTVNVRTCDNCKDQSVNVLYRGHGMFVVSALGPG